MIKYLVALVLLSFVSAAQTEADLTWVNSKYHDKGAHWWVFGGIIAFICIFQSSGLLCELWYRWNNERGCHSLA